MTPVRLEPAIPRSRVKHCTTESLRSQNCLVYYRYGCIEPLFLTSEKQRFPSGEEVKLYWMVNKCDSSAPRFLVELCENPGKDGDLNTLVPVTKETVTYRNKYCALCNEVDFIRTSSNWQLDINCETVFDWSNPSIIKAMEENKCEVIFVPPTGAITKTCEKRPPYYISTCNVTGQWQKFDEAIDVACRSFVDAFNLTYRNYFCYLCNTAEPLAPVIDMECQLTHNDFVLNIVPPFSALVDLDVMQDMNDEPKLSCDKHTQFEDKKLVRSYSKTYVKRPLSKRQKIGFQDRLSLNAGQKYCRMLQVFCNNFDLH